MTTKFDPGAAAAPGSGIFGLPHNAADAAVVLVPVPFEATCSYGGGTSNGPQAILDASRQVDLFDTETGRPYQAGIHMLPMPQDVLHWNHTARELAEPIIAAGGEVDSDPALLRARDNVNVLCDKMNGYVRTNVRAHLQQGKIVGCVGGDHSISFGSVEAYAEKYPGLGVLHVDAHADLRDAYEGFTWSHASIMRNVVDHLPGVARLVQVGIRDLSEEEHDVAQSSGGRIRLHTDVEMAASLGEGHAWSNLVQRILEPLPQHVYISFDIDGFDPALCPHTGTPVPGGLSWHQALTLIRILARSGRKIVGFDLTEVAPGPQGDEWDANVGARLLYKMVGWALKTR